ncbi:MULTISPECIES: K(+)-transporting ATPase subunit F [Marinospirillum]
MNSVWLLASLGLASLMLAIYLLVALLNPERF